jgi:hypothetical protein
MELFMAIFWHDARCRLLFNGCERHATKQSELIVIDGNVPEVRFGEVAGRHPLTATEMSCFSEVVNARADDIIAKWIDFFVLHKSVKPEHITKRLK